MLRVGGLALCDEVGLQPYKETGSPEPATDHEVLPTPTICFWWWPTPC
jgi:hypothetical protein